MSIETSWQTKLIKKINSEGGYAHKRAHAYSGGIVDLMLIHPLIGTVFVETKMLKPTHMGKFKLQMPFTEQQKNEGKLIRDAGGTAFGIAFVYEKPTNVWLAATPLPEPRSSVSVTHADVAAMGWKWQKSGSSVADWILENIRRVRNGK